MLKTYLCYKYHIISKPDKISDFAGGWEVSDEEVETIKKSHLFTAEPAENTESPKKHLSHLSALRDLGGKQIQEIYQRRIEKMEKFHTNRGIILKEGLNCY